MPFTRNHPPLLFYCLQLIIMLSILHDRLSAQGKTASDYEKRWKLNKIIDADQFTANDYRALSVARGAAKECTRALETAIEKKIISEEELFCFLYFPIFPLTSPRTFSTFYDDYTDSVITPIEDRYLNANPSFMYVTLLDKNGYLPSHNSKYAQPPTGNAEIDFLYSRNKRIFNDLAGYISGKNTDPFILQVYYRDTGERLADLSVPIYVTGKHWGSLRVGYRREN
ncbi:chemotaxis protein [candidate division KSB1 bacterium]|nr:chemotaxis protein [candidate division KSB1 bacterium]